MTENRKETNVIYFTRLHWVIFLGPVAGLLFSVILGSVVEQLREVSLYLSVFFLISIIMTWVTYYFSSVTIKKNQVILRTGLLVRKTIDIPLAKIETIDIRQSILGSILQYGALIITGTGGTRHSINFIYKPLTCRRHIEQLMHPV